MEKLIKGLPVKEYHVLATRKWQLENPDKVRGYNEKYRKSEKGIKTNHKNNSLWCEAHRTERTRYERERRLRKKLEEQNNISKGE